MKIYSTRHGQTDYNKNDLILGTTDIELNETGLKQAHELAEEIKKSGIKIDIIIGISDEAFIQNSGDNIRGEFN